MTSEVRVAIVLVFAAAGCEWGGGPGPAPDHKVYLDAPVAPPVDAPRKDAPAVDASVDARVDAAMTTDAPPATEHLLLTEIAVAPDGAEFIEIYNPMAQAVDLSKYYLTNHGSYFKLPVGGESIPTAHFIVQFKPGTTLDAGAVITVATQSKAAFTSFYGSAPTYSITDGDLLATAVTSTPRLTDGGAFLVLFSWDGTSGLVKDVDMMVVGAPSGTNTPIDKSGVMQLGATYATDANALKPQASAPGIQQSTKRILREDGHETQNGTGNGITGHDETSEHTDVTWDSAFTAPTPGTVPAL